MPPHRREEHHDKRVEDALKNTTLPKGKEIITPIQANVFLRRPEYLRLTPKEKVELLTKWIGEAEYPDIKTRFELIRDQIMKEHTGKDTWDKS